MEFNFLILSLFSKTKLKAATRRTIVCIGGGGGGRDGDGSIASGGEGVALAAARAAEYTKAQVEPPAAAQAAARIAAGEPPDTGNKRP